MYSEKIGINPVFLLQKVMGLDAYRQDNEFDIYLYNFGTNEYICKSKGLFYENELKINPTNILDISSLLLDDFKKTTINITNTDIPFLSARVKVKNYSNKVDRVFIPKLRATSNILELTLKDVSQICLYPSFEILEHNGVYFECFSEDNDWFEGE